MKYPYTHILIRYGELALKGRNQNRFIEALMRNIQTRLGSARGIISLHSRRGYILIDALNFAPKDIAGIVRKLCQVCGIVLVSPVLFLKEKKFDAICAMNKKIAEYYPQESKKFCVRVKRADKTYPVSSGELEKKIGQYILENTPWKSVSLKNPDKIFYVDIVDEGVFVYAEKENGVGGLPVGIEGKVLSLLSGGIDSPVASYYLARRGCEVDFIHFTANKMQSDEAREYKIAEIVKILSQYSIHSKLYVLPYIHFNLAVVGKEMDYELILFRRFMARVAKCLAKKIGAQALVTGDNLGQVASQTLSNIVSTSMAVDIPIFRPLIGFEKNEIIGMAKKINTYDISIQPYKDCCSLISKNPRTSSYNDKLEIIEKNIIENYDKVVEDTLSDAIVLEIKNGSIID